MASVRGQGRHRLTDQVDEIRAQALVDAHGSSASQILIEQITVAVRAGDDVTVSMLDRQLQHVDALIERRATIGGGSLKVA